jgi:glycosyltransferase involved in cell wall biosynthesis
MLILIGNLLSGHNLNPTAIEDLSDSLVQKYPLKTASNKNNPFLRLLDMLLIVFRNRYNCKLIIIDVFSTNAFLFSVFTILLARLYKINYMPVFRGGSLIERYNNNPKIFNFLFKNNQIIICPSGYLANFFIKLKYNVQVIPNYIDIKKYNFIVRDTLRPRLLWVRSIHSIYNPIMAVRVLEILNKEYSDSRLCLVGPEKDDAIIELKSVIEDQNLQSHVILTGQLSKEEWSDLSTEYDIFINTTNFDNHPVTLLEVMALGLPIVSTNVGGIPYLINDGETGILVKQNDVHAMVQGVKGLLDGTIDANMISNNARKKVLDYGKEKVIKEWHRKIDHYMIDKEN